jgi:hypothetical protein
VAARRAVRDDQPHTRDPPGRSGGLTMAACSSSGSRAATPPAATTSTTATPQASTTGTISAAAAGSAYLTDVAPANAALTTFGTKVSAWTDSTTNAQAEADAQPAITALRTLDTALTNAQWPASATAEPDSKSA